MHSGEDRQPESDQARPGHASNRHHMNECQSRPLQKGHIVEYVSTQSVPVYDAGTESYSSSWSTRIPVYSLEDCQPSISSPSPRASVYSTEDSQSGFRGRSARAPVNGPEDPQVPHSNAGACAPVSCPKISETFFSSLRVATEKPSPASLGASRQKEESFSKTPASAPVLDPLTRDIPSCRPLSSLRYEELSIPTMKSPHDSSLDGVSGSSPNETKACSSQGASSSRTTTINDELIETPSTAQDNRSSDSAALSDMSLAQESEASHLKQRSIDRAMKFLVHYLDDLTGSSRMAKGHEDCSSSNSADMSTSANCNESQPDQSRSSKRARDDDEPLSNEERGSRKKHKRSQSLSSTSRGAVRYACPFAKHNPWKYMRQRPCCGPGWANIGRIK
jgi:hypothetical protein